MADEVMKANNGWLPIATAPREACGLEGQGCLLGGLWNQDARRWMRISIIEWVHVMGWYEAYSGKGAGWVTHWMPLSDPPEANCAD